MKRPPYENAKAFTRAYTLWSSFPGTAAALLIAAYFAAVVDLGTDGWGVLLAFIAVQIVATSIVGVVHRKRLSRDIVEGIEAHASGSLSAELALRAYAASRTLPQRALAFHVWSYLSAGFIAAPMLKLVLPDVPTFSSVVIAVGSITGGAACMPFALWAMRHFVAPTRDWFAARVPAADRALQPTAMTLAQKLALPMMATAGVTVAFLALLGYSVATNALESRDVTVKAKFLERSLGPIRTNPAAARHLAEVAAAQGVADGIAIVSLRAPSLGAELELTPREIAWIRASSAPAGSSRGLDSHASFAWVLLGPDRALVAATPLAELQAELGSTLGVVIVTLLAALALSAAVALLVARDARGIAERLRAESARIGGGDFTAGAPIESEDELGAVANAFVQMREQLGSTIARVTATASRVEEAAAQLSKIGATVRDTTAAQVDGIERANSAITLVNRQATEITGSTQELIGGVEDASSSVLELGAASEELNQTAIALNSQVETVGSSIDQMVRSVAAAGEAGEALNLAVTDTNASVAEMARTMQSVDAHAWETARLSTRVIELADGGRDRVQETMRGMEVIRDATDAANRTIGGLAERMQEIGAIVDVIDEIADETNLLALNAAIIAAQAGDQGRAFSVVADEIKDLADRVLSNTKEIGGLIRSVQAESATAATSIRQGAEHVQGGVELSAQAGVALEEITAAARHAGERIQEIVQAMREQTRSASHVEQLAHGVGDQVEQIRVSMREQARGNEVVMRGSHVMRDVAQQTQRTTEEQARGALRIRDSIEGVREAVDRIHASLQRQSESCRNAATSLSEVFERTRSNDEATDVLGAAAQALQQQAKALRDDVNKFRLA